MKHGTTLGDRIPSIDGLRAVAIALVMINHAAEVARPSIGSSGWRAAAMAVLGNGKFGVDVFFVLSGFLITRLLLAERAREGAIDLSAFYVRRAFRILPAYYTYILAIAALWGLGVVPAQSRDFLHALTFTWTYNLGELNFYLSHSWSLSVEEQFYLAWPLAMILMRPRAAAWLASCMIVVVPLAGLGYLVLDAGFARKACFILAKSHADVLMSGCLVALWWDAPGFRSVVARTIGRRLPLPLLSAALASSAAASLHPEAGRLLTPFLRTANGAAIALAMACFVSDPASVAGRILNLRLVARVGVLSYSLYLWQQLFLVPRPLGPIQSFPLNLMAASAMATLSYYLVERPSLGLRKRMFDDRVAIAPGSLGGRTGDLSSTAMARIPRTFS